ncbi:uncharacterized protein LOC128726007 [Anopheles nili]|uniref:uncharacterized protein LOC128726007 n=1 Tax=Anopheles nili TaxID=185578 RepID=UPI00237A9B1E|nr:uncharacterized protein LOC128726007 [Anopheles nili]
MNKLRSCCVPCCKNEKFSLVHKFPSDNERAEQWRQILAIDSFIGLPIEIIRKRYYICSRHFRDADYKNKASRSINITAVPSINLTTLNDPEGLNREIPPLLRAPMPASLPFVDDGHESKIPGQEQRNLSQSHHIKLEADEMGKSSSITIELNDFIEESFSPSGVPFLGLNEAKAPSRVEKSATFKSTERRYLSKRSIPSGSAVAEGQPKAKVSPTDTNNLLSAAIAKPITGALSTGAGLLTTEKARLLLKRVKGPSFMIERKKGTLTSATTQTDDELAFDNTPAPSKNADEEDRKDEGKAATSTKVLALLECTPENLQRLKQKLHDQGGSLCIDERLLRLDDEQDKAMCPGKADESLDESRFLTVCNPATKETASVSYVWLRDHCHCSACYNATTFQRSTSILELPLDIKPASCDVNEGEQRIDIKWSDGHQSTYDFDVVFSNQVDTFRLRLEYRHAQLVLWDREAITASTAGYARVTLNDLLCEDDVMRQIVSSLVTYGFALITKVPPNQPSTEMAVKRLFPVQRTLFGDMWTFSESKMDHSDTAYTNGFLGPHTDNTYFCDAAGLQVLHCIQFNGQGGETILVDGFRAAERLRESDSAAYGRLCEYPLEAEYIEEDKHHRYVAPVLKRHPLRPDAIEQIRFNPYDRAPLRTLAPTAVPQFYADYQRLAAEVYREEEQWKFQLTPGTVLIFDNWRVLHGRMAYNGKRVMTGCYVARTEYQSVARTMGLIE